MKWEVERRETREHDRCGCFKRSSGHHSRCEGLSHTRSLPGKPEWRPFHRTGSSSHEASFARDVFPSPSKTVVRGPSLGYTRDPL